MVRHPGIVDIFDQGHFEDGVPWLLMEYVEGETLEERIHSIHAGKVPHTHDPIAILYQVAHVLSALHARGIVHRDLKPPNIKLMPDPSRPEGELAKLLDFGIAKFVTDNLLTLSDEGPVAVRTHTDVIMGTPPYMAPEQCISAASVTAAADVYALGVIAYELLSGRRPFTMEWPAIGHMKLTQDAPQLDTPGLPDDLVSLVMSMLRRNEAERPAMLQIVDALGKLGGRGVSGAQVRLIEERLLARESSLKRRWLLGGFTVCGLLVLLAPTTLWRSKFSVQPGANPDLLQAVPVIDLGVVGKESAETPDLSHTIAVATQVTDMGLQQDMSASAPLLTGGPLEKGQNDCVPMTPTVNCIRGDGLSKEHIEILMKAAQRAGLQICRGQTLILEPSLTGFLECGRRPARVTSGMCTRFVLALDGLSHVGLATPKRVEITCR